VDYHPSDQYIAFVDTETGEGDERRLNHSDGEAEKFYRNWRSEESACAWGWKPPAIHAGSSGYWQNWASSCGSAMRRKSKPNESTSRRPIATMLNFCCSLLLDNNFPKIWVPSPENRDLRQLLWHRHRLVQMRTRIMNQLQALAMNEGQRRKKKLWSEAGRAQLEKLALAPWASRRRKDLLELLDGMNPSIGELTQAAEQEAKKRPEVLRLMTHPGVGPLTALAFVLIIGTVERFQCGKQIGSYVGLIPCEDSSAGHQRLGHITKQGSSLLRFLLGEAAQAAARCDAHWRQRYVHLAMRRQRNIAKVAMARRLGVRLYWMWRKRLGVCAVGQVQFARGTARYRRWRAVERRPLEWASRSLARGSLNG